MKGQREIPTRIFKFTIAYEGTRYAGWQRQKNKATLQETLERSCKRILGEHPHVVGAGRTDSGVHALGQVAHLKAKTFLSPGALQKALNAVLPEDILIRSISVSPPDFHARYDAASKWYRYTIWNKPIRPLFDRPFVHHVNKPLNVAAMKRAARLLRGRHDFKAFCSEPGGASGSASSTVRTLKRLHVTASGGTLTIDAEANGFLYHMVRRLAGLLLEVGRGRISTQDVQALLRGTGTLIAPTAPAQGLCLMRVRY